MIPASLHWYAKYADILCASADESASVGGRVRVGVACLTRSSSSCCGHVCVYFSVRASKRLSITATRVVKTDFYHNRYSGWARVDFGEAKDGHWLCSSYRLEGQQCSHDMLGEDAVCADEDALMINEATTVYQPLGVLGGQDLNPLGYTI